MSEGTVSQYSSDNEAKIDNHDIDMLEEEPMVAVESQLFT